MHNVIAGIRLIRSFRFKLRSATAGKAGVSRASKSFLLYLRSSSGNAICTNVVRHFFMKRLFQIIFIFGTISSFGQDKEVVLKGDSLFVRDENIATNPFAFGRDPLTHLKTKIKFSKPTIVVATVANRHVDNDVDTTYAITFGRDSFNLYKWDKDENALLSSYVTTDRFTTRHGIKIGMTKIQIKNLLKNYDIRTIPKYLILENTEIIEYMILEFNSDILKRIEFQGYFD
jgi:hypothetical protein